MCIANSRATIKKALKKKYNQYAKKGEKTESYKMFGLKPQKVEQGE